MPLEENPYIVPHLKALISVQKFWGGQSCGSNLSLRNALLKIINLLHKMASDRFHMILAVFVDLSHYSLYLDFEHRKTSAFSTFRTFAV